MYDYVLAVWLVLLCLLLLLSWAVHIIFNISGEVIFEAILGFFGTIFALAILFFAGYQVYDCGREIVLRLTGNMPKEDDRQEIIRLSPSERWTAIAKFTGGLAGIVFMLYWVREFLRYGESFAYMILMLTLIPAVVAINGGMELFKKHEMTDLGQRLFVLSIFVGLGILIAIGMFDWLR
jgi:hypothetical protein